MNNKLIINTNLLRKELEFKTKSCAVEKAIMNKRKQETKENTGENRQKFIKFEKENNYVKFLLRTDEWPEIRQFRSAV